MGRTSIEWLKGSDGAEGYSWNALRARRKTGGRAGITANHCEAVNEACRFCYADALNRRLGGLPFKPGHRKDYDFIVDERTLLDPLRRRRPARIFVESMSDAFGDWWPRSFIVRLYAVMALCPGHLFVNLTKRPERRRLLLGAPDFAEDVAEEAKRIAAGFKRPRPEPTRWPLPNVVEGTSVSCQLEADAFVPILLRTPAALRVLSCEPLLGPIELYRRGWLRPREAGRSEPPHLDGVIAGGESGRRARAMDPDWPRHLRSQCTEFGVAAFHFKQWGEWAWAPDDLNYEQAERWGRRRFGAAVRFELHATGRTAFKVGKKRSGRLLDGLEHNGFPAAA